MDFSSKVRRGALDQHMKESTELHLKMTCEKLREFQNLLEGNVGNVEEIQANVVEANRRISDLSGAVRQSNLVLQELLQDRVGLSDKVLNDLRKEQSDINDKQDALQSEVDSLDKKVGEFEERASNDKAWLQSSINGFEDLQQEVMSVIRCQKNHSLSLQSLSKRVSHDVTGLQNSINDGLEDLQQELASIESRQNSHYWKLEDLTKRVSNERAWLELSMIPLDNLENDIRCIKIRQRDDSQDLNYLTKRVDKQQYDLQLIKGTVIFLIVIVVSIVLSYYLATSSTK